MRLARSSVSAALAHRKQPLSAGPSMYVRRHGVHSRSTKLEYGTPSSMPTQQLPPALTPLQRAIYETDQLGLTLRDSIKLVTARMGFFVGQHKYLSERVKIERFLAQNGAQP